MFKSDSESKRQSILYGKKKTGRFKKNFDHATSASPKFSTRHVGVADWPRHLITDQDGGGGGGGLFVGKENDAVLYLAFAYRVVRFAVVMVCALVTVLAKESVCATVATLDRTVRVK